MKHSTVFTMLCAMVAFVFMLTACNSGGGGGAAGDPAAATKAFFDALYGGTASDAMFCNANAASVKASMEQAKQALTASGATIDVSGLKYEVASQSGDAANVKVSGKGSSRIVSL